MSQDNRQGSVCDVAFLPSVEAFPPAGTAAPLALVLRVCTLHPHMVVVDMHHQLVHCAELARTVEPVTLVAVSVGCFRLG